MCPVAAIRSPGSRRLKRLYSSSPSRSRWAYSWRLPCWSLMCRNVALPITRNVMMRPATVTSSVFSTSGTYFARASVVGMMLSTKTPYGAMPAARSSSAFALRWEKMSSSCFCSASAEMISSDMVDSFVIRWDFAENIIYTSNPVFSRKKHVRKPPSHAHFPGENAVMPEKGHSGALPMVFSGSAATASSIARSSSVTR